MRTRDRRSWLRALLRIGGSVFALFVLFRFLPLNEVWSTLHRLPLYLWVLVIAGYLCAHLIAINKWRMMVNLAGACLTFRQSVRFYFSGLFSTLFLPSIIGGDLVRGALALRVGQSRAAVFMGGLLDRILDFASLALLVGLSVVLIPDALPARAHRIFEVAGVAVFIFIVLIVPVILWFPARKLSFAWRRGMVRLRRTTRSMRAQPYRVAAGLCLGLMVQGSFIWLTSCIADASGLHLLFRAWLFAWPLAKLAALIPITQGGIGVREAALVVLLVPFGAPTVKTAAVGLAWEAVIVSGGLIAGLTALLMGRIRVSTTATPRLGIAAENSPRSKLPSL